MSERRWPTFTENSPLHIAAERSRTFLHHSTDTVAASHTVSRIMTAIISLGTFETVSLREAWPAEDINFTPWLAQPANIKLLGDTLKIDLEVEATEHWVGPFRADILAREIDSETDHRVIIENQFGRTNHGHLGQILTYLAGIEGAKTIVWIAETIQADHRAAIDWLNENTKDDFSFFAVEIELWRIGNSPPAPRFNVVASPNDWTRTIRSVTKDDAVLANAQRVRLAYWASFGEYLREKGSQFNIRRPIKDHWCTFGIGRAGFHINATISTEKERLCVELWIVDDADKSKFRALHAQKPTIEQEIGEPLSWQELPSKKGSRIALYRNGVDPADPGQYLELHGWMLDKITRFKNVFASRVRSMAEADDENSEAEQ
jgi:hypothetical protein